MASLYDVAKRAGVSKTLVSRTINGQSGVSEKSREKIMTAIKELQYEPNGLARSLVLKRTHTIGVVMDTLCEPYFFKLIDGIERQVSQTGYDVVFRSGHNSTELKKRATQYFSQGRTDGMLLYGSNLDDEKLIEGLMNSAFPFVVIENDLPNLNINNIVVDNKFGSRLAVDHLLDCGCRKIFHIGGDMRQKVAFDRRDGYVMAMQSHGLTVSSDMIIEADFSLQRGYQAIRDFIDTRGRDSLPDAFYCGADNTAYGAMMALEDAGLQIGADIQMVGFDDDNPPMVDRRVPKLTTISQPLMEMGKSAVEMLLNDIEHRPETKQRLQFFPELVLRETTCPKA